MGSMVRASLRGTFGPDDSVISVFAKLGVALLLFLAGLELDFRKLRGHPLELALPAFVASLVIGLALALPLGALGIVINPLLVAGIAYLASQRAAWRHRVDEVLGRLQDTSAQLRVRAAMLLMIALLVVSEELKFDATLGSFLAGALLSALADPAREEELGHVRHKLEAIGFGFFVPIFFVATGLSFPIDQLFSDWSTTVRVPLFLAMLLAVRGLPVLLLRRDLERAELVPSALLQATSLSFIVVAAQIGVTVHELEPINAASLRGRGNAVRPVLPGRRAQAAATQSRRCRSGIRSRRTGRRRDVSEPTEPATCRRRRRASGGDRSWCRWGRRGGSRSAGD